MEKKINYEEYYVWQDREVKFDITKNQLCMRPGEKTFESVPNIEDTKGNNGDVGTLIFTNLRSIWYSRDNIKINLSIGYDCILSYDVRSISSKIAGETRAICLKCKFNNNRFEFLFNAVGNNSPNLFGIFDNVFKSYESTRLYRDIKMKGFLTPEKTLNVLSKEKILNKLPNIYYISADNQTSCGNYIATNVRLIWYNNSSENNNISLPWIHIKDLRIKDHPKHGKIISIETNKFVGNSVFNFKFDNVENCLKEIEITYLKYLKDPIFGCDLNNFEPGINKNLENIKNEINKNNVQNNSIKKNVIDKRNLPDDNTIEKQTQEVNKFIKNSKDDEDIEIIENNYFNEQSNIFYYMTSHTEKKPNLNDIIYSQELGMAVEKLPENMSLDSLWKIILN